MYKLKENPLNESSTLAQSTAPVLTSPDPAPPWKVLVADDDRDVHEVTRLALRDFAFDDRPLKFISAYSATEALEALAKDPEIAVLLLDVVMESKHAGLEIVAKIREQLGNRRLRIILRTGQPGVAPEREVIQQYDINDYREKTELTATRLHTSIHSALSAYRDLTRIDRQAEGLREVVAASLAAACAESRDECAASALGTLVEMIFGSADLGYVNAEMQWLDSDGEVTVLATMGQGAEQAGNVFKRLFGNEKDYRLLIEIPERWVMDLDTESLVDVFLNQLAPQLGKLAAYELMEESQRELVMMLASAIEQRSLETGNHVRRVSEYSRLLGQLVGLPKDQIEVLATAAPLHDAGKIGIPDAILNKPGKLDDAEFGLMKTHAKLGGDIFVDNQLPVLQAAATIAAEHHERWDGTGYPAGLAADNIHIFGRIVAIADVYDALTSERCYKPAWTEEQALKYLWQERGSHFDPELIDLWMANIGAVATIRQRYADD